MKLVNSTHRVTTWLVLAVGVTHTLATFVFYDGLSEPAVMFSGAGLGGIFVALLNFGLWQRGTPSSARKTTGAANVLFAAWLAAGFAATPALFSGVILAIGGMMSLSGVTLACSETRRETG